MLGFTEARLCDEHEDSSNDSAPFSNQRNLKPKSKMKCDDGGRGVWSGSQTVGDKVGLREMGRARGAGSTH